MKGQIPTPSLPPLNLPQAVLKLATRDGHVMVFDPLRCKYVTLTPEEYVRQHFTAYMIQHRHYPASVTANEVQINLNDTIRRCDTVVFGPDAHPLMIVEYKAPSVSVTQDVFDQIVRYNMVLHASYLVVSNGLSHYCCRIDYASRSYGFMPEMPDYRDIFTI